jgi:hypothetical protein
VGKYARTGRTEAQVRLPLPSTSRQARDAFTNLPDPDPRSRRVFACTSPRLAEWLAADTLDAWVKGHGAFTAADDTKPASVRARLRAMPGGERAFLFPNQLQAVVNLEHSLFQNRPRALIQMATGSGKTVVMAMLIAWHTLNKRANPQDGRFSDAFLIVTPGITIRDRLRVLLPNDPQTTTGSVTSSLRRTVSGSR